MNDQKLYRITTSKGTMHIGGKTQEEAKQAYLRIYPHRKILNIKEIIK